MGIAIFLRKNHSTNRFRDILINSLNSGIGDKALICSGFFQENFRNSNYQSSQEPNFINALVSNNIELITIGIHNNYWLNSYKNFRDNLQSSGVNITAKYKKGLKWHAKIYILFSKNIPILGIIGSSNITRNAFSVSKPFNYESDVILWSKSKLVNNFMEEQLSPINDSYEFIRASYDSQINGNLSVADRLKKLENEIKIDSLNDL